jgi:uncharacterized protein with NRDE domain
MCLVALAVDQSRRFPLVIASNRDEFFNRPAARLAWWSSKPGAVSILGGRDLDSGGTWLGLTAQGRIALLTNVRGVLATDPDAPSRGRIVTEWLAGQEPSDRFWMRTALSGHNGFNLIAADFLRGECFWASNTGAHPQRLVRGVYGLSNGGLDTPWPKVEALKTRLVAAMEDAPSADELAIHLFAALGDRHIADDGELPRTGVPLDLERQLSAAFIRTPDQHYGTRCSTLVITERTGRQPVTHVFERSFNASGSVALLRRAALRNWPPRYTEGVTHEPVEEAVVAESEIGHGLEDAPHARRTRVRSLLKPAERRRKHVTGEPA